jgi:hypothetical protein
MEALMWRASSVVITYGAIRAEKGGASGTKEREKKINQGAFDKAKLGSEKNAGAASSGSSGKSFTLGPLSFPSGKNLVPAPLRFLWFPEKDSKNIEEVSRTTSIASSVIGT